MVLPTSHISQFCSKSALSKSSSWIEPHLFKTFICDLLPRSHMFRRIYFLMFSVEERALLPSAPSKKDIYLIIQTLLLLAWKMNIWSANKSQVLLLRFFLNSCKLTIFNILIVSLRSVSFPFPGAAILVKKARNLQLFVGSWRSPGFGGQSLSHVHSFLFF